MVAQKRVAIYARVSTLAKGQTPETQLVGLREYATRRGFVLAGEYVDYASGLRDDRPHYRRLMEAARKRHIDVVLVWRYDRFARSTQALVQALHEFQRNRSGIENLGLALQSRHGIPCHYGNIACPTARHLGADPT
jgi:DNA invertase Pin-like site-specific DNA recombinase